MELRDFIVTPLTLIVVYTLAYLVRPRVTDHNTRKYFLPALTVKIIGALAVGLVYQFYYGGGDTFAFHTHGSRVIWEALLNDPTKGLKLFFADGEHHGDIYEYSSRIWYFRDQQTYLVIRIAALLDLFTFSTYSATAILFALLSFSGVWVMYLAFYSELKGGHFWLALAILFVPSVFFWGSGILKDTLTLGCLGWMTFTFHALAIKRRINLLYLGLFVITALLTFFVKKYILLSFLPALIIWVTSKYLNNIRRAILRVLIAPIILLICILLGHLDLLS